MNGDPANQPPAGAFSASPAEAVARSARTGLWRPGERVLVAVSGGPDSVALLHLLATLGREAGLAGVTAAHVDHGLRPDSGEDARVAEAVARRLGVPFRVRRVTVEAEPGLQAGARRARYQALEAMREEAGCDLVATGHTLDDQAETVVLRLARGTSPRGLRGIPVRRGRIIRPLLATRRAELEAWCRTHDLPWRADPSNADARFHRVRVRREVLPLLAERLNPAVPEALARLAALAADEDAWIEQEVDRLAGEAGECDVGLDCGTIAEAPRPLARRLLARAWSRAGEGVRADALEALLRLCTEEPGPRRRLTLPGGVLAERSLGRLFLLAQAPGPPPGPVPVRGPGEVDLGEAGRVRVLPPEAAAPPGASPARAPIIASGGQPLWLRTPRPGDRLRGGPRVARLLSKARVPAALRGRLPVLVSGAPDGGEVLWVAGQAVWSPKSREGEGPLWRFVWEPPGAEASPPGSPRRRRGLDP